MNRENESLQFLGKTVTVAIDRPLGSNHPTHGFRYPLNYGFLPATKSGDGEELDAYVLGVAVPLAEFTGECIAVIQRNEENDDKLVVVPAGTKLSADEIRRATHFQEQYFSSRITVAGCAAVPPAPTPTRAPRTTACAVEQDSDLPTRRMRLRSARLPRP